MIGSHGEFGARWIRGRCLLNAAAFVLIAGTLVVSAVARAEDSDDTAAWMPSLAISWGVYSQKIDGTTSSTESALSPSGGDSLITTMFQFEGKLHTPFQFDIATRPRIFFTGGVQIPLAEELIAQRIDNSFNLGDPLFSQNCPANLDVPVPGPPLNPNRNVSTCSLRIRNRITLDAMWYVGVGVDFTIPVLDNQFHIAPAVEYYGLAAHTVGDFQRSSSGLQLDDSVEIANAVGNTKIYHGISESLTLSVDVFENGPWRWSMFIQQRVGFLLTDPFTSASESLGTNRITFVSDLDDLVVQGTGGIQLQWTGTGRRR